MTLRMLKHIVPWILFMGCGASSQRPSEIATSPVRSDSQSSTSGAARPKEFDPCDNSRPMPKEYFGILKSARCEQEMFLKMASVATQLGVECNYCHAPSANDPKREDYPVKTEKKEIANWMHMHLMQAIKPKDGSKMKCASCHTNEQGKPVAKILGNPRDMAKAIEWMNLVMVNRFVGLNGEKLKCKSCHQGNFETPQFKSKVILMSDQIPQHETPQKEHKEDVIGYWNSVQP